MGGRTLKEIKIMTLQEIQYKAQAIMQKWRDEDSAPYIEFVEELALMIVPELDKSLEEEISRTYHDGSVTDTEDIDHIAYENIARHFAEWQEKQDLRWAGEIHKNGYNLCKEQMLKDAVEGTVKRPEGYYQGYVEIIKFVDESLQHGDKVKIVIVKED